MSDTPINAEPFNCPDCGSHDYGLYAPIFGACPHCMKRENADLRAKLEVATKDAERYRLLRALWTFPEWERCLGKPVSSPKDVDAAIDAAIAQGKGEK